MIRALFFPLHLLIATIFASTLLCSEAKAWNTPVIANSSKYTAWTWTGAIDNDWNKGGNWCGSFLNGACRGQTTAPTASSSVVFNDACTTNCNPTLSSDTVIYAMTLASNFTGSINQGAYKLDIGAGGYAQHAGTFNAGSAALSVGTAAIIPEFRVDGGSFLGGSGNISIGLAPTAINVNAVGGLFISNCTFRMPSSTFTAQNLSVQILSTTTFNHNNGLISFESPANWMSLFVNQTLHNVVLKVGNTKRIQLLTDLYIDGDLTANGTHSTHGILQNFSIVLSQGNFYHTGNKIQGNTKIKFTGTTQQLVDNSGANTNQYDVPGLEMAQTAVSASVKFVGPISVTGGIIATSSMGTIDVSGVATFYMGVTSLCGTYNAPQITFGNVDVWSAADSCIRLDRLIVAGNLTFSSGSSATYSYSAGVIDLYGNLLQKSDWGSSGSGLTIRMVGTSAQVINNTGSTWGWIPALEFANTGAGVTFTGLTPTLTGNLTYTSGVVTMPTNVGLRASSTSTIRMAGIPFTNVEIEANCRNLNFTQNLTVNGNLAISNTSTSYSIDGGIIDVKGNVYTTAAGKGMGGTGTIRLSGSTDQSIDFTLSSARLPKVDIASTGGTVSILGNVTVAGASFKHTSGTVAATTSTVSFNDAAGGTTITPGTMEFGNVSLYTYSNGFTISGTPLTVRGSLDVDCQTNGSRFLNGQAVVVYGNVSYLRYAMPGSSQLQMVGSANSTLSVASTATVTNVTLQIQKTLGASVTLATPFTLAGTRSIAIAAGTLDLGAAANALTIGGSLTLASGASVKLSGAALTVGGSPVTAGPYSSGTIVP